jgi:hypothetical protein
MYAPKANTFHAASGGLNCPIGFSCMTLDRNSAVVQRLTLVSLATSAKSQCLPCVVQRGFTWLARAVLHFCSLPFGALSKGHN